MNLKLNPTQQITLILALLSIGGLIANPKLQVLWHLLATLGFGLILFWIFKAISKKPKNIYNTVISCLIIFLVLNYGFQTSDLIYALVTTFITISSKFFLNVKGLPVINPVVLGLLTTYWGSKLLGLAPAFISWWGASYKIPVSGLSWPIPASLIIVAVWIIFGLRKWRKFWIFGSFLITYIAAILIFWNPNGETMKMDTIKFIFTDSTIYFLAGIMLIEPKTSPILRNQQIIFGILAGVFICGYFFFGLPQFDLVAIAAANLYFFCTKYLKNLKTTPIAPANS